MNSHDNNPAQPIRELEWLIHYFKEHSREDLAQEIFEKIRQLRHRAQDSLANDASEIIQLNPTRRKSSE